MTPNPQLGSFCYTLIAAGGARTNTPWYTVHTIILLVCLGFHLIILQLYCRPAMTPFPPVAVSAYRASHPPGFCLFIELPIRFLDMQTCSYDLKHSTLHSVLDGAWDGFASQKRGDVPFRPWWPHLHTGFEYQWLAPSCHSDLSEGRQPNPTQPI